MVRFLIPLLFLCFSSFSQSVLHYVGPVHSNQKNTLFAKEQYIYITSPYQEGPVYVKISKFGEFQTEVFSMEVGRSISYRVGDDDETPLVIVTDDLGKNLSDKGMKVEGFRDASLTLPTPIFVETRFQAGNYNANPQTQYTSWNTIDGFQEPNDCCSSESNEENYAHIWWNGLWNDLYSGAELPFIVEFEYNTDSIGDDYIFLGLFDGHSYFMSKGRDFSWGESREIAISLGGYLVSINTQEEQDQICLLYTSPSPRDRSLSRMPSSA